MTILSINMVFYRFAVGFLFFGMFFTSGVKAQRTNATRTPPIAKFDWFKYEGNDPVFRNIKKGNYTNPILTGFYPDPSITKVGENYYLITSTFSYFPGIPVFQSRDLVNWKQIGNVIDRPGMLDFDGLGLSRGVFAPTIEYHEGVFYVANTCVDCGGNFIVTAKDPAGTWSDPVWIKDVGGIDPSLFFDDDGSVYLMNNDAPPEKPLYDGHRAIWIRKIDRKTLQPIEKPTVIVNGGVKPEEKPIWIEGPHIYKQKDWYYLSAAEGGTAEGHSQVLLRAKNIKGPYEPYPGNPILTQRHLPRDRKNPITSVGHADFVEDNQGNWWATFLGVRPYEGDFYNTGRETFLMKARWENDWLIIADRDEQVKYSAEMPTFKKQPMPIIPLSGNFSITENFDKPMLDLYWLFVRVPKEKWYFLKDGKLNISARSEQLGAGKQPSFIARRQQHLNSAAETCVEFVPTRSGDEAGLAVFQNDDYYYSLGITKINGKEAIVLKKRAGSKSLRDGNVIKTFYIDRNTNDPIYLKIASNGKFYSFYFALKKKNWKAIAENLDGKILSTKSAGGFVGAVYGMYAQTD